MECTLGCAGVVVVLSKTSLLRTKAHVGLAKLLGLVLLVLEELEYVEVVYCVRADVVVVLSKTSLLRTKARVGLANIA